MTARSPSTCAQTEGQYLRKARHRARKGIGSTLNPIPKCPLRASNPPSRNLIQQRIVLAGFRHICRGNPIVVTHLLMCVVGTFPGRHRGLPLRPISAIIFPDAIVVVGQVAHFNLTPEASLCRGFYFLPFVLSKGWGRRWRPAVSTLARSGDLARTRISVGRDWKHLKPPPEVPLACFQSAVTKPRPTAESPSACH